MVADRDRAAAQDPEIGPPDAIVLTGDLVFGAPLGTPDHETELDAQYEVAADFIERIADHFLDGDRARVVIVPGNHDVDWNVAREAMEPVAEADVPARFSLMSCGPTSDWRWSWEERRVYKIIDRDRYQARLARFDALIESFYDGVDIAREPLYRVHSLNQGRIAVVAFDSCLGNDCFAYHGEIAEDAMADAFLDLHDEPYELCIAAWHHSIEGEPREGDYMSHAIVEGLIGKDFRLGLHGHQHAAAASNRNIYLPDKETMAVISAGSMCAGGPHLPVGINRQYNLIEIAEDLCSARVHVREMSLGHNFAPTRRPEFGFSSFLELKWRLPTTRANTQAENQAKLTVEAEQALREGREEDAEAILSTLPTPPGSYARNLRVTALRELSAWEPLVELLDQPQNAADLLAATHALLEMGEPDRAEDYLEHHHRRIGLAEPVAEDLRALIAAKRALR